MTFTPIDPDDVWQGWRYIIETLNDDLKAMHGDGRLKGFNPVQVKEKFGELRVYWDYEGGDEVYDDLMTLVDNYCYISSHTCAYCGKFHVPMTYCGWILPVCRECYEANENYKRSYDEVTPEKEYDPYHYTYTTWSPDGCHEKHTIDVTKEVKKIESKKG